MHACRNRLESLTLDIASHSGLLLSRYLRVAVPGRRDDEKNHPEARKTLHKAAQSAAANAVGIYSLAFERWKTCLPQPCANETLHVQGRLIVGLGGDNVLETGVTLHHTYGVPIIPGSALKGLAAHYADRFWGMSDDKWKKEDRVYHETIFGAHDDAGHILFHDGWIAPDSLKNDGHSGLVHDVMTPHHGNYYAGKTYGDGPKKGQLIPPSDFDDPKPVSFLSVAGAFLVAVSCDVPGEEGARWAALALDLLKEALREWGVGGKTSSGYGRLNDPARRASSALDVLPAEPAAPRPRYRPGQVLTVTRVADPKGKDRPWFEADDGFAGTVVGGAPPGIELGQQVTLEVAAPLAGGYNFRLPGRGEASKRSQSGGSEGGRYRPSGRGRRR